MIITRTPFRISFAGGGSDLPAFYSQGPGAVLSTAIDRYMYITIKDRFGDSFRISYSRTELVETPDQIQHPIVRASFEMMNVRRGVEVVSIADLPAQSGMGSSSSFTVGLLHAIHALNGRSVTAQTLAAQACEVEIDRLQQPIGKQDQYIAAHGGIQFIQFQPDGTVFVDPVICSRETLRALNQHLVLYYTGVTRSANEVLTKQRDNTPQKLGVLRRLCSLAHQLRDILTEGRNLKEFGKVLHESWEAKKCLESSIHNPLLDDQYDRALRAGAIGGKLLGAGGGGFFLFFCEPHLQANLRAALYDLQEVPFSLEPQGSKVIYVGTDR